MAATARKVKREKSKAEAKAEKRNGAKVSQLLHRDVKASQQNDAKIQIASGGNALARYAPYMRNVANGILDPEVQTEMVLRGVNDIIAAHREKIGDPNKVPPVNKQRVNEMKSIISLGLLKKAYPTIVGYFEAFEISRDDIVAISRYCRNDLDLKADDAAPSQDVLWKVIKAKRAVKRGGGGDGDTKPKKATAAVEHIGGVTEALMLWFKSDPLFTPFRKEAAACINTIMRETAVLQAVADKATAAKKAADLAAKAKAKNKKKR